MTTHAAVCDPTRRSRHRAGLALALALVAATPAAGQTTQIEDVIMYGIDADTRELMRYSFETDTFEVIGVASNSSGQTLTDCEALGYIPTGPAKGMYCIPRKGASAGELIRLNPLDATGTTIADLGWPGVQGMVAYQDATGTWALIVGVEPNGPGNKRIYVVDPLTGANSFLFEVGDRDPEGLAIDANGTLYMTDGDDLFTIDWSDGSLTNKGSLGYSRPEALEFGFGFSGDPVDLTSKGVPAAWTANGALFSFDDGDDQLFVVNPATGNTVAISCAFGTVDCEGLVFTTKYGDGFGQITALCHD